MHNLKKNRLKKGTAAVMAAITMLSVGIPTNVVRADATYDYSNAIYSGGTEDTYVYEMNDKIITTKTEVKRTIPEVSGQYDISYYPIPLVNEMPSEEVFELIKAENKELMDNVESDIANGTLTKHIAADGQFYGTIADDVLGVEKTAYINTNSKGSHSLASYVPAGEIATVTLSEEALAYAKKGLIKITVGATMIDADEYEPTKGSHNRMPYLGKTFSVSEQVTKVGTPFGGMVSIEIDESLPDGLQLEIQVKGVVDTPYYDLGQTTTQEWQESKDSAGLFAEIRTPYLRFYVPSYFVRDIEDPYESLLFWTNATALSTTVMAQEDRTTPITLIFDDYDTSDGSAYASIGSWICNLPTAWVFAALDYDTLMKSGNWGLIHEINHHFQTRYVSYFDEWGVGEEYFGEITNNVLNTISYILYTNIAAYRGEDGLDDWLKVADPYSSLKQQMLDSDGYYSTTPNMGDYMYSTFAHEIGPVTLANIIKSTYDGATFNGIEIPAYDYKAESEGKLSLADRYDDYAYRICVASERDYLWYIQEELNWPLSKETVAKIESLGYEKVIPVQSVYAMGELGRETGRAFYVPSSGYTFNFEESIVSPGETTVVSVSKPKYGTLNKLEDGTYAYVPASTMKDGETDEFILTVLVTADGISRETKLNCTIGISYDSVSVEHYEITKWDINEALETLKTSTPYKTTVSTGMKIYAEDGNNLVKSTGYFSVTESGEYTFQAYGDDRAAFELTTDSSTTYQSLTVDNAATVEEAYTQQGATHFSAYLEAGKAYSYTLVANNNGGIGWADVQILSTSQGSSWQSIDTVSNTIKDLGRGTDRTFTSPEPVFVRPSSLAASDTMTLKGVSVISTPQGVANVTDSDSVNEGDPNNIVDGNVSTYFHSSYTEEDKTPLPHEYIFDLGQDQTFNHIDMLYRITGDECGVIGDYEIYVANVYDDIDTEWTLVANDDTRQGNSSAPNDIEVSLDATTARYVMIRVLNNRGDYDLSILAEVAFSMKSTVNKVIGQNSSYIQYTGNWSKDTLGVFVNGATYNTTDGYFMYCFYGTETNLYVTQDTDAEIRIDGGEWKTVHLTGSLRAPSVTLVTENLGNHSVEIRGTGNTIALNMVSTDGSFYKGSAPSTDNTLKIVGATKLELPVSKVDAFDPLAGVSYTDTLGITGLEIEVSGKLGKPSAGTNKDYTLTYSITDSYKNTASVNRIVTVTNQMPEFQGLSDITITQGEGKDYDYKKGVTATDYEDGNVTITEIPTLDLTKLSVGEYTVEYKAKDSDGNVTVAKRNVVVKATTPTTTTPPTATPTTAKLSSVKKVTAKTVSTTKIKLSWSKVSKATGYKIYRYDTAKKKYVLIKTIKKNTTVTYNDTKLKSATTYKYKVVAYSKTAKSTAVKASASTKPATVKIKKITLSSKSATVAWSKVKGASGYEVYRSTSKTGKYTKVATVKKVSTVKYKNTKLKANKTYYYKVRAYRTVNGKKVYGAFSSVKSIKVK